MATEDQRAPGMDAATPLTQMEFAVQMSCQSCVDAITRALDGQAGVESVYVVLEDELVLVKTCLTSSQVQEMLESTGKLVVFRGYGSAGVSQAPPSTHHGAAVAILHEGGRKGAGQAVKGLLRLVQTSPGVCVVEGTIDGLCRGERHAVCVHQYGDLSGGLQSCGGVYCGDGGLPIGHLCTVEADDSGRANFQLVSGELKVWEVIGRAMVLHRTSQPQDSDRLAGGVIARSAGLFQNTKKVCTCDGVTIWEEARKSKEGREVRAAL